MPYEIDPAASRPWADAYRRREPQNDPGDLVRINGFQTFGTADPAAQAVFLVVAPLAHGQVPEAWDGATALYTMDDFEAEFVAATDADLDVWRLQQHAASLAADEIRERDGRDSPWAFTRPDSKRPRSRRDPAPPKKSAEQIQAAVEA